MSIPGGETRVIDQQILMLRRGIKGDLRHFKLDERRRGACVSERGLKLMSGRFSTSTSRSQYHVSVERRRKMRKATKKGKGALTYHVVPWL
jgi:hypothetical protein